MSRRRKIVRLLFAVLVIPLLGVLVWALAIQPLKYAILVHGVETAQTAEEEQAAFMRAADWGRLWEVDRLLPEDAPARDRGLTGDWIYRIEFLPSSPYGGGAYVAYRSVIDTNNLRILRERQY
jgi:hypothetical protein